MLEDTILSIVHFTLGSILVFFAAKAYLRTKHSSIFYSMLGFALIVVGHALFEIYFYDNTGIWKFDKILDILVLIAFIIAVKES